MKEKSKLFENIKNLENELESFNNDIEDTNIENQLSKKKIIEEIKSGEFDNMLNEIQERKNNKKKESLLEKLFKIF